MTERLTGFGVVLVTTTSETEAENLIRSIYRWQGQIENESEWQLAIKSDLKQFEQLSAKIQELHTYAVPEIIALPIVAGSQTYLDWLASHTGRVSE